MSGTCFECKFMRQRTDLEPCEHCTNVFAMTGTHPNFEPRKPITHYDEIRAMSIEEIENWFWWMHKEMMRYTDSRVFLHDWLKQGAET